MHRRRQRFAVAYQLLHAKRLKSERYVHDRSRMALAGGQVDDPPRRQKVQPPAVGQQVALDQRPDVAHAPGGQRAQLVEVDLDVEVSGVGQQRPVLHPFEMLLSQHATRAGDRHEHITTLGGGQSGHHLVARHPGLQCAQGIHFADDHRRPGASGALGDSLARPAVADHDQRVPRKQHVAGPHDPVEGRLSRAVAVVERSLGPRFVERQYRAGQLTALLQPPEPHEAGGRLLGPADQALEHRTTGGVSRHQQVSAVIDRDLRAAFQQSTDVRGIGLSILSMDRPYLDPVPGHERGGHVILNREWVC